jgi:hypothetical protein
MGNEMYKVIMTEDRKKEIKEEAKRRIDLWLSNASFDEMSVHGSLTRFNMAIGLLGGYPFEKEDWMTESDFDGFVTEDEFNSIEYDDIIEQLFQDCMSKKGSK